MVGDGVRDLFGVSLGLKPCKNKTYHEMWYYGENEGYKGFFSSLPLSVAKVVPFLLAFTKFKIDAFDDLHHQRMSEAEEKAKATQHTLTIFFSCDDNERRRSGSSFILHI